MAIKAANPFANFSALTQKAPSLDSRLPVMNFGGAATQNTPSTGFSIQSNVSTSTQKFQSSDSQQQIKTFNSVSQKDSDISAQSSKVISAAPALDNTLPSNPKIRKLNQRFLEWVNRQMETNPTSIWTDGVQVQMLYIKILNGPSSFKLMNFIVLYSLIGLH